MRHGFLLINKPAGITSHDAVAIVRRTLPEKHVGHLGTLDPAATGLLVLAVGAKALKVIELFNNLSKEYEAGVHFGHVSTTYDAEGVLEETAMKPGWVIPDESTIRNIIADRFLGRIKQVPPAHSAVHVGGERAYRKARQGLSVDIPAREVLVSACDVLSYNYPDLQLRIACGSGTYIRSLAHDLGQFVKVGAYISSLKRTKVGLPTVVSSGARAKAGDWSVEHAVAPDAVKWAHVLPLKDVMSSFPALVLTDEEMRDIGFGRSLAKEIQETTIAWHQELPVAILEPKEGMAHPRKVF